jgi:hypothetical protein
MRTSDQPSAAKRRAQLVPNPDDAPVMTAVLVMREKLSNRAPAVAQHRRGFRRVG